MLCFCCQKAARLWVHQPKFLEQPLDRRGRLQVLRHIADGMVQHMLERADYQQAGVRAAGRELLASCVLRQLILFFTPHNANKARTAMFLLTRQFKLHHAPL